MPSNGSQNNQVIDHNNIPLEEKCRMMMDTVVCTRVRSTENIRKADKNIANMEAALLKKEMRFNIEPIHEINVDPSAFDLLNKTYDVAEVDTVVANELKRNIENLNKVLTQIKEDKTGYLLYKSKTYYE